MKFGDPKPLKNMDVKKISVETEDGNPVRIVTKKCESFGVKKSEKFGTKSMSIILDEDSKNEFENIIENCEDHLKMNLSKILYERNDGSVTLYPKIRDFEEFRSVFYDEKGVEIDLMKFEGKRCELKAVLEIEGILVKEEEDSSASLQVKIYEAMLKEKVYEHERVLKW